jgi:hypothetical protein
MDRRTALKSLAITVWGMMVLPGCGTDELQEAGFLYKSLPLNKIQKQNLQSLIDTLLPETDTKGGLELGVDRFLDKLLANCYELEIQESFVVGLDKLEENAKSTHDKSFFDSDRNNREQMLLSMNDEEKIEDKAFFDLTKELAVLAYTSSEYFLTNFTNYEMIPGGYDGCVPVPNEPFKI